MHIFCSAVELEDGVGDTVCKVCFSKNQTKPMKNRELLLLLLLLILFYFYFLVDFFFFFYSDLLFTFLSPLLSSWLLKNQTISSSMWVLQGITSTVVLGYRFGFQ